MLCRLGWFWSCSDSLPAFKVLEIQACILTPSLSSQSSHPLYCVFCNGSGMKMKTHVSHLKRVLLASQRRMKTATEAQQHSFCQGRSTTQTRQAGRQAPQSRKLTQFLSCRWVLTVTPLVEAYAVQCDVICWFLDSAKGRGVVESGLRNVWHPGVWQTGMYARGLESGGGL